MFVVVVVVVVSLSQSVCLGDVLVSPETIRGDHVAPSGLRHRVLVSGLIPVLLLGGARLGNDVPTTCMCVANSITSTTNTCPRQNKYNKHESSSVGFEKRGAHVVFT